MASEPKKLCETCSFCGVKAEDEKVGYIVATEEVGICGSCVESCVESIRNAKIRDLAKAQEGVAEGHGAKCPKCPKCGSEDITIKRYVKDHPNYCNKCACHWIDWQQAEIERLMDENRTLRIDNERNLNESIELCHIRAVAHDEIRRLHVIEQSHSLCPEVIDGLKDEISRLQSESDAVDLCTVPSGQYLKALEIADERGKEISRLQGILREIAEHRVNLINYSVDYTIGFNAGMRESASIAKKGLS